MQTTPQEKEKNKKQIISLVLISLSILIGFFFTMDQGYSYIEKKDTLETTKKEANEKKAELTKLEALINTIKTNTGLLDDIERFGSTFREDIIIDSLFAHINGISIASFSVSRGEKSPNGLSLATVSLSLKAEDISALSNYLNYLTNSKANKRSYVIKNISFPLDTTKNEAVSVNLSLGMYYFE